VKLDEDGYFYLFEFSVFEQDDQDEVEMERVWQCVFEDE